MPIISPRAIVLYTSPVLTLNGVSKTYPGSVALQSTDLSFMPGQTTVLIGPSGCGKSTLLRLLIGLVEADGGTIDMDGRRLSAGTLPALRRLMGYVIQEGGLFPHLNAEDNVTLMARYLGWARGRIAARLEELAALVRLPADSLRRFPGELSGGQRQRVSLMRALMLDPQVLLLDEPLGALDPMIRHELQRELKAIFRRLAKTVVLVTHDIAEAGLFANVIVLMREGRVVQQGSLRDLVERPADPFVGRFVQAQADSWRAIRDVLA